MEFDKEKEDLLHDERYDRTIRALSAEVALKVMKSRVAITPMNGINTEFMKNIILDGSNVTIFDDSLVTQDDVETNFMFGPDDIGKNKGEVLKIKFNDMNPHAKIEISRLGDIKNLHSDIETWKKTFENFDVITVSTSNFQEMFLWDELAQILNKPLYILVCCGLFGFIWVNLGKNFTFIEAKSQVEHFLLGENGLKKDDSNQPKQQQFESVTFNSAPLEKCLDPNVRNKTTIYYAIIMMYLAQRAGINYDPLNPDESAAEKILSMGKKIYDVNKMKYTDVVETTLK